MTYRRYEQEAALAELNREVRYLSQLCGRLLYITIFNLSALIALCIWLTWSKP